MTDLGTKPTGDAQGFPAVAFGRGSTGTLNGVTMQRNSTGISLAASQSVKLQDVTVSESSENGIVLRGDRATVLSGVKASATARTACACRQPGAGRSPGSARRATRARACRYPVRRGSRSGT